MDGIWTGYGRDMDGMWMGHAGRHPWMVFVLFVPPGIPVRHPSAPRPGPPTARSGQCVSLSTPCFPHLPSINRLRSQSNQIEHTTNTLSSYHTYKTNGRTNQRENQSHASEIVSRPPRRIFVTKPPSREPPWPPRTARRSPIRDRQTTSFFTRRTFDGSTTRRRCPRIARSPSPRNRVPPSPPPSCRSWPPSTTSRRAG